MSEGKAVEAGSNSAEWRKAITGFERWLRGFQRWVFLAWLLGYGGMAGIGAMHNPRIWWFVAAGVIGLPLISRLYALWRRGRGLPQQRPAYEQKLLDDLAHAELAQRLRSGELTGAEPREYVWRGLRWLVPEIPSADRARLLRRVNTWLEWYQGPPRRKASQYWIMPAVFLLMPLFNITLAWIPGNGGSESVLLMVALALMFMWITASKYEAEGRLLVEYLYGAWEISTAEPELVAPLALDAPTVQQTRLPLLIINQAQQDLQRSNYESLILPLLLTWPVALVELQQASGFAWIERILPWLLFVPIVVQSIGHPWVATTYRKRLRQRLDNSMLAARLAAGECTHEQLAAHTPRLLRFMLLNPSPPKAYADELRRQLWRVAFNLEWYLGPPRRLWYWYWLALFSAGGALAGWGAYTIYYEVSYYQPSGPEPASVGIVIAVVLLLLGIIPAVHCARNSIWIGELAAYLRRCAAPVDNAPP